MAQADDIVSVPDDRLRQRARRVGVITDDVLDTIQTMKAAALAWEQTRDNEVGVALAAPQIGVLERIVIVRHQPDDRNDHRFDTFINPEITKYEGEIGAEPEGCLSVPDTYGLVPRHGAIRVSAMDTGGETFRLKTTGFLARVLQHEIDHLRGQLFVDAVTDDAFYRLTDHGKLKALTKQEIDADRVFWNG
jgi:peptide deformylase